MIGLFYAIGIINGVLSTRDNKVVNGMNERDENKILLGKIIEQSSGLNKMLLMNLIEFKLSGDGLIATAKLQSANRHLLGAQKSVAGLLKTVTDSDVTLSIGLIAVPDQIDTDQALIGWGRHKPEQMKRSGRH